MPKLYGKVIGWGAYAPAKIVTNDDLAKRVDTSDEWIVQRSGIRQRHIAEDHETTSTMSTAAAQRALAVAGISAEELDCIILATSTPDYHTPPVSSLLQAQLGATDCPAFTVVTGCTGFVYAYSIANQFIQSGAYKNILVVGAELLSRFLNWEDRTTCVLFGDAAGAVVIQATTEPCGMFSFVLGSDGDQGEAIIMRSGGSKKPFGAEALADRDHFLEMNGREVFRFASRVVGRACVDVLTRARMPLAEIDWIIPHQANLRIIEAASKDMGVPMEKFIVNIDRYGNTSAASIPLALAEGLDSGRIKPTDKILMVSFGAGLTWGAAILQMQPEVSIQTEAPPVAVNGFHKHAETAIAH